MGLGSLKQDENDLIGYSFATHRSSQSEFRLQEALNIGRTASVYFWIGSLFILTHTLSKMMTGF
jgi:hypothetical protein